MLERFLLVCVLCGLGALAQGDLSRSQIIVGPENIINEGYPAETHHVTTPDGYILEMHRIPFGILSHTNQVNRPVVFLMHGLMGASPNFVSLGANYSMAYNLADEGFDVWMGNARGNHLSRRHVTLNPDDNIEKLQFFNFTFEEIALHDLPTMIDYVLDHTAKEQLQYIGHSQGGTVFLILTSMKPEYNKKIASAHLLAGVGYQEYFPNEFLIEQAEHVDFIFAYAFMNGIVELYPELIVELAPGSRKLDYCTGNVEQKYMCELFGIRHILRSDSPTSEPSGAALKQAAHYGQNIRDKLFRRYHYREHNMHMYGTEVPPMYNISFITCNVTMHYSMSDNLLDERDVLAMVADMPNARARRVARDSFEHTDYIGSLDAKELVTDYIIAAMKYTLGINGLASTILLNTYLTAFSLSLLFISYRNL